jgi:hypothetical protein
MTRATETPTPLAGIAPGTELDIVLGTRGPEPCAGGCGRTLPRLDLAAYEIETPTGTLCPYCCDRAARPLRLVCLLMEEVLKLQRAGDEAGARGTIQAVVSAMELLDESRPRPRHQPPARQQPVRHNRRGQKR